MAEKLCAHVPCRCIPEPPAIYCDPVCERAEAKAGPEPADTCPCGHPECHPEKARRAGQDEPVEPSS